MVSSNDGSDDFDVELEEYFVWKKAQDAKELEIEVSEWKASSRRSFEHILDGTEKLLRNKNFSSLSTRNIFGEPLPEHAHLRDEAEGLIRRLIQLTKDIVNPDWSGRNIRSLKIGNLQKSGLSRTEKRSRLASSISSVSHLIADEVDYGGINLWANQLTTGLEALNAGETQQILTADVRSGQMLKRHTRSRLELCALAWVSYYSSGKNDYASYERVAQAFGVEIRTLKSWKRLSEKHLGEQKVEETLGNEDLIYSLDKYCWQYFDIPGQEESRPEVEFYGGYYQNFIRENQTK